MILDLTLTLAFKIGQLPIKSDMVLMSNCAKVGALAQRVTIPLKFGLKRLHYNAQDFRQAANMEQGLAGGV